MAAWDPKGRWVLVTGASSGIGRELARAAARAGARLVLVARSVDRLVELERELSAQGTSVLVVASDLAQPGAARQVFDTVQEAGIELDALVNNAGVGRAKALAGDEPGPVLSLLDLNCRALTELTMLFLPGIRARGDGGILLVASLVSFFPVPEMAAYAASKAYVRSFGEALGAELGGSGVHVTVLCPGNVPSGFQEAAGFREGALDTPGVLSAERTAELAWRGFVRRRGRVVPGWVNRLALLGTSLLPNPWIARIAAQVLKRTGRFD
ncbi:MAG TPA: SDR family NAD(P)-dependent oxidoreductase [Polyangiaceae bacterium]|nr:SDR family NAD(P)-dependent oxidoreductase [Polyangiaceae bacterium]